MARFWVELALLSFLPQLKKKENLTVPKFENEARKYKYNQIQKDKKCVLT